MLKKVLKIVFVLLFTFGLNVFCNGLEEQAGDIQQSANIELVNSILPMSVTYGSLAYKFLSEDVLGKYFLDIDSKNRALILSNALKNDYHKVVLDTSATQSYKEQERLTILEKLQKKAHAKITVFKLFCKNSLTNNDINVLKLRICDFFYTQIKFYQNKEYDIRLLQDFIFDNRLITDAVTYFLKENFNIDCEQKKILKVDLFGLWEPLYTKYIDVINNYEKNKFNLNSFDIKKLNEIVGDLTLQLDILDRIDYTQRYAKNLIGKFIKVPAISVKRVNQDDYLISAGYYTKERRVQESELRCSTKIFDAFLLKLLQIKEKIIKAQKIDKQLNALEDNKKDLCILHLILMRQSNLDLFRKFLEFEDLFEQYQDILKKYLNDIEIKNKDLFHYDLKFVLSELNNLKDGQKVSIIWKFIGFTDKQNNDFCKILKNMILILHMIDVQLNKAEQSTGTLANIISLINKLLPADSSESTSIQQLIDKALSSDKVTQLILAAIGG